MDADGIGNGTTGTSVALSMVASDPSRRQLGDQGRHVIMRVPAIYRIRPSSVSYQAIRTDLVPGVGVRRAFDAVPSTLPAGRCGRPASASPACAAAAAIGRWWVDPMNLGSRSGEAGRPQSTR